MTVICVCKCYNLTEAYKTNINLISNISQNKKRRKNKGLRAMAVKQMYETKFIKIYFKDAK